MMSKECSYFGNAKELIKVFDKTQEKRKQVEKEAEAKLKDVFDKYKDGISNIVENMSDDECLVFALRGQADDNIHPELYFMTMGCIAKLKPDVIQAIKDIGQTI
jgi:hypothetical protein